MLIVNKKFTIPHVPFYFVRHGETEWNRIGRVIGNQNIELNPIGIEQAHTIGKTIKALKITKIISSPLIRAKQTAEIINEHLTLELDIYENLHACKLGVLEGVERSHPAFNKWATEWGQGFTPSGGEEFDEFLDRVASSFATILDPKHLLLIVSHGRIYRGLIRILNAQTAHQKAENCGLYFFCPPTDKDPNWIVYGLHE